jgi:hypothetical protein
MEGHHPSPSDPESRSRRQHRLAGLAMVAILAAVILGPFLPLLLGQATLFFNDVTELNVPLRHFFGEAWSRGEFPLWCPDVYLGFPLFAEGQAGPLYPPNLLVFALLPAWWAMGVSWVLHLFLAALGTFLFARRFCDSGAALLAGLAYGLTGHLMAHHMHLNLVQASALLPWVLWFLDRLVSSGRAVDLAGTAMAFGLLALVGHPQSTLQAGVTLVLYAALRIAFLCPARQQPPVARANTRVPATPAVRSPGGAPRLWAGLSVLLALGLGSALYTVHVLPALELTGDSVRREAMTSREQMAQHTTPQSLAAAVVPSAFGTPGNDTHWLAPGGMPRPGLDLFLGAGVVFLAAAAAFGSRRRVALVFLGLSGLFVLVSFGPLVLGVPDLYQLPILSSLRFPDRLGLPVSLFGALLAAEGFQAALRGRLSTWAVLAAAVVVVGVTVAILAFTYTRGMPAGLAPELSRDGIIALASLVLGATSLFLAPKRRWLAACLAVLAVAGPLVANARLQVPVTDPSYWDTPPTARVIRETLCPGYGDGQSNLSDECPPGKRLDRVAFRNVPRHYLRTGWLKDMKPYEGTVDSLVFNLPLLYGIPAVDGIFPLRSHEFLDLYHPITRDPRASFGPLGARFLVTTRNDVSGSLRLIHDGPVRVYEDAAALPRAFPVHDIEVVANAGERIERVVSGKGLLDRAILSAAPPDLALSPAAEGTSSTVQVASYGNDRVVLSAAMAADGLVVLLDRDYPGWQARVDGAPVSILRANHFFRAVPVPEGNHQIEFVFRPASVYRGAAVSLSALVTILAIGIGIPAWRRRRPAGSTASPEQPQPANPASSLTYETNAATWVKIALVILFLGILALSLHLSADTWNAAFVPFRG